MKAGAGRYGERGMNSIIVKKNGVKPRRSFFLLMRKPRAISLIRIFATAGVPFNFTHHGHDHDIHEIASSCPAQMGVAKSHDRTIRIVITGTPVPTPGVGIRAELYHTKGQGSAGKSMAMASGANKRINIGGKVGCFACLIGNRFPAGKSHSQDNDVYAYWSKPAHL